MWVMTFADLMSLLLAFFVLLFSFSEMDAQKYKQVAGSMKEAFGVQRQVKVKDPPKGVNVIAREFTPGRTEPTPLNQVKQSTIDDFHPYPVLGERYTEIPDAEKEEIEKEAEKIKLALEEGSGRGSSKWRPTAARSSFASGKKALSHRAAPSSSTPSAR